MKRLRLFMLNLLLLMSSFSHAQPLHFVPQIHHSGAITAQAVHPNGKWLATAGVDHKIIIWDAHEHKIVYSITRMGDYPKALIFHPHKDSLVLYLKDEGYYLNRVSISNGIPLIKKLDFGVGNFVGFSYRYRLTNWAEEKIVLIGERGYTLLDCKNDNVNEFTGFPTYFKNKNSWSLFGDGVNLYDGSVGLLAHHLDSIVVFSQQNPDINGLFKMKGEMLLDYALDPNSNLLAVSHDEGVEVFDIQTGNQLVFYPGKYFQLNFSPNGKMLMLRKSEVVAMIIDPVQGTIIEELNKRVIKDGLFLTDDFFVSFAENAPVFYRTDTWAELPANTVSNPIKQVILSPDNEKVLFVAQGAIFTFNRNTLISKMIFNPYGKNVNQMIFSRDQKRLIVGCSDFSIMVFNYADMSMLLEFNVDLKPLEYRHKQDHFSNFCLSEDDRYLYTGIEGRFFSQNSPVYKIDLQSGKAITYSATSDEDGAVKAVYVLQDGNILVERSTEIQLLDANTLKEKYVYQLKKNDDVSSFYASSLSPKGDRLAVVSPDTVFILDVEKLKLIQRLEMEAKSPNQMLFLDDSTLVLTEFSFDYNLKVINTSDGTVRKILEGHNYEVNNLYCEDNLVVSSGEDSKIIFWDAKSFENSLNYHLLMKKKGDFYVQYKDEPDYLILSSDGYYARSNQASDLVSFTMGVKAFRAERLDFELNRHDKILEKIAENPEERIEFYKKIIDKRLTNANHLGLGVQDVRGVPELERMMCNLHTEDSILPLRIRAVAHEVNRIKAINIWVNGVPVYGKKGLLLSNRGRIILDTTLQIQLQPGDNFVEYSIRDEYGLEGERLSLLINSTAKQVPSNLYIITMAVSNYKDPNYNLQYAVKDGQDIIKSLTDFSKEHGEFKEMYSHAFFDDAVNIHTLDSIKKILNKTKINDRVIFFLAGHGLLDSNYNFYFSSHDMDFSNPSDKGIPYGQIESILELIPARERLLLIDACHSGQVDYSRLKVETKNTDLARNEVHRTQFNTRGAETENTEISTSQKMEFEEMRTLYGDFANGTGTQIIAATGGDSYAYESSEWNNGLFTYCLLQTLQLNRTELDKNWDKKFNLEEWKNIVEQKVIDLSGGKQVPVSKNWNVYANLVLRTWK